MTLFFSVSNHLNPNYFHLAQTLIFMFSRSGGRIKRVKPKVLASKSDGTLNLKSIGGRINRVPFENNVGGSVAVS